MGKIQVIVKYITFEVYETWTEFLNMTRCHTLSYFTWQNISLLLCHPTKYDWICMQNNIRILLITNNTSTVRTLQMHISIWQSFDIKHLYMTVRKQGVPSRIHKAKKQFSSSISLWGSCLDTVLGFSYSC